jgi:hypothetical protein
MDIFSATKQARAARDCFLDKIMRISLPLLDVSAGTRCRYVAAACFHYLTG